LLALGLAETHADTDGDLEKVLDAVTDWLTVVERVLVTVAEVDGLCDVDRVKEFDAVTDWLTVFERVLVTDTLCVGLADVVADNVSVRVDDVEAVIVAVIDGLIVVDRE
jgi:hypothetical protein